MKKASFLCNLLLWLNQYYIIRGLSCCALVSCDVIRLFLEPLL